MTIAGFEPGFSGIGSNRSVNWATTIARLAESIITAQFCVICVMNL